MKKGILPAVALALCLAALNASAATSVDASIRDIEAQIAKLQSKLAELKAVQAAELSAASAPAGTAYRLTRDLSAGVSGIDVEIVQELLAADATLYPEKIATGYYGSLSVAAIKRFQKLSGLPQDGIVSGATREKLNAYLLERSLTVGESGVRYCVPPGTSLASGLKKNGKMPLIAACGQAKVAAVAPTPAFVKASSTDFTAPEFYYLDVIRSGDTSVTVAVGLTEPAYATLRYAPSYEALNASAKTIQSPSTSSVHSFVVSGLSIGTTYNLRVIVKDLSANEATSPMKSFSTAAPGDKEAPVVSDVRVHDLAKTSATVVWSTNESSRDTLVYSAGLPLNLTAAKSVVSSVYTTSHSVPVTGLLPATTYSFIIKTTDLKGNAATSKEWTFTTPVNDVTPPALLSATGVSTGPTAATVAFSTNEPARGAVHYGFSDPLDISTAGAAFSGAFVASHVVPLSNLRPATTYRYLIVSTDASGNISTSTVRMFKTP